MGNGKARWVQLTFCQIPKLKVKWKCTGLATDFIQVYAPVLLRVSLSVNSDDWANHCCPWNPSVSACLQISTMPRGLSASLMQLWLRDVARIYSDLHGPPVPCCRCHRIWAEGQVTEARHAVKTAWSLLRLLGVCSRVFNRPLHLLLWIFSHTQFCTSKSAAFWWMLAAPPSRTSKPCVAGLKRGPIWYGASYECAKTSAHELLTGVHIGRGYQVPDPFVQSVQHKL